MNSRNQTNYQPSYFGRRQEFNNRQEKQPGAFNSNNSLTSKIVRSAQSTSLYASAESTSRAFRVGNAPQEMRSTNYNRPICNNNNNGVKIKTNNGWNKPISAPFSESLVLQAQLRDVKIWSKYKCAKLDLLFDLHAVIGSEFGLNDFGGITFTLRDSTDSLTVVYYEIDSELPEIKQGEWVRVGGTPRPWGFQVTSVKKMSSTQFLEGFYEKLVGSRMVLERRVNELNLDNI